MKRGIIATVIIILVTATAIWTNISLTKRISHLENTAFQAANGKADFNILVEEWNNQEPFFKILTDHKCFENIDSEISMLKNMSEDEIRTACLEISIHFDALRENISVSWENLF